MSQVLRMAPIHADPFLSVRSKSKSNRKSLIETDQILPSPSSEHMHLKLDFGYLAASDATHQALESILALRGLPLVEAAHSVLMRRGLDPDNVLLFLDRSNTPIPWDTDTSYLIGQTIIVQYKGTSTRPDRPDTLPPIGPSACISVPGGNYARAASTFAGTASFLRRESAASSPTRKNSLVSIGRKARSVDQRSASSLVLDNTRHLNGETAAMNVPAAGDIRRHRSQGRLSQIFPTITLKQERPDLSTRLFRYTMSGFPDIRQYLNTTMDDVSLPHLESHWSELVGRDKSLSRKQIEHQEAVWELIQTEHTYLSELLALNELSASLLELQQEGYLDDVDAKLVFGNIVELYQANLKFWDRVIYPVLRDARDNECPLDPLLFLHGFHECSKFFQPYVTYFMQQCLQTHYIRKTLKENDQFRDFCQWLQQTRKEVGRLKLSDVLIKPMQRITKYQLLLKAIHKTCAIPQTQTSLSEAVLIMEDFVSAINLELRYRQHKESLIQLMSTIESYDAIDPISEEVDRVVRPHCSLDLTMPMSGCHYQQLRALIYRGDLRLKDAYSKVDVHCLLLTDMFLVCKPTSKRDRDRLRVKIIKPPFHIDKLRVTMLKDTHGFVMVYTNDFDVASNAFLMLTNSHAETSKWLERFRCAKDTYCYYRDQTDRRPDSHPSHLHQSASETALLMSSRLDIPSMLYADGRVSFSQGDLQARRSSVGALESARRLTVTDIPAINHGRSSSVDADLLTGASRTAEDVCVSPVGGDAGARRMNAIKRRASPRLPNPSAKLSDASTNSSVRTEEVTSTESLQPPKPTLEEEPKTPVLETIIPFAQRLPYTDESHVDEMATEIYRSRTEVEERPEDMSQLCRMVAEEFGREEEAKEEPEEEEEHAQESPVDDLPLAPMLPRRTQRRYHTADAIREMKPRAGCSSQIHKRFSLNARVAHPPTPRAPNRSQLNGDASTSHSLESFRAYSSSNDSSQSSLLLDEPLPPDSPAAFTGTVHATFVRPDVLDEVNGISTILINNPPLCDSDCRTIAESPTTDGDDVVFVHNL